MSHERKCVSRKQCDRWARQWIDLFGLQQWRISVVCEPVMLLDGGEKRASSDVDHFNLQARMRVATGQEPKDVCSSIGHEMLHLLCAELVDLGKAASLQLGENAAKVLADQIDAAEERLVVTLERALAKLDLN